MDHPVQGIDPAHLCHGREIRSNCCALGHRTRDTNVSYDLRVKEWASWLIYSAVDTDVNGIRRSKTRPKCIEECLKCRTFIAALQFKDANRLAIGTNALGKIIEAGNLRWRKGSGGRGFNRQSIPDSTVVKSKNAFDDAL